MHLKSKAMPGEITSMEEFVARVLSHDWTYCMSDDHRCWVAGEADRAAIRAFCDGNTIAAKLWANLCKEQANGNAAWHLVRYVEPVLHNVDGAVDKLQDLCMTYLATTCKDTMIGKCIRDSVAKTNIKDCPPPWDSARADERETAIDKHVEMWKEVNA